MKSHTRQNFFHTNIIQKYKNSISSKILIVHYQLTGKKTLVPTILRSAGTYTQSLPAPRFWKISVSRPVPAPKFERNFCPYFVRTWQNQIHPVLRPYSVLRKANSSAPVPVSVPTITLRSVYEYGTLDPKFTRMLSVLWNWKINPYLFRTPYRRFENKPAPHCSGFQVHPLSVPSQHQHFGTGTGRVRIPSLHSAVWYLPITSS